MVKVDQKAVLIVIDGWGIPSDRSPKDGDAIAAAETPIMDSFAAPNSKTAQGYTQLEASSLAVGLPEGLMGNSEVGHLNIGAGRVVWQDVVRIDQTLKKGEFNKVKTLTDCFKRAVNGNGRLHLLGLVSDGGVHSHINHLVGLLKVAKEMNVPKVYIHFFGDGRDTDPKSAAGYMEDLLAKTKAVGTGEIATVVGRYYIMDRDKRWDRVEEGMKGVVLGEGEESTNPVATIKERYSKGENDEFLKPIIVGGKEARVQDNDTLFFFNYRSDRVREVTQLLGGVDRSPKPDFPYPKNISITTMTQYKSDYPFPVAFLPQRMGNVLAEWLGKQGVKQCHIAETEKYAHVTFFFNGGVEKQFEAEDRDMIPSPKVATYDLDPKMSAAEVADKLCSRISGGKHEFLMNNFAPPDMVGHTGVYEAAIEGVAATDKAIGKVYETCKKEGFVLFITSDHGNAEEMLNEQGKPKTSHTTNKVPFIMANAPGRWSLKKQDGVLGDVAPTLLQVMGLKQPEEMGGESRTISSFPQVKHETSMSIALPLVSLNKSLGPRCVQYVRVPTLRKLVSWPALDQRAIATVASPETIPHRKQLKDEAKQRRLAGNAEHDEARKAKEERAKRWELTVGIEVHAQLNTERKLFSRARTSTNAEPNSRVALFDLAYPGTQPEFQKATLIPALRAATALKCIIQRRSRFDRKHYFYPDQPAGYQITQYYEPFAKDGLITLFDHDGIAPEDGESVTIGIKQIQMEQDTAKTIHQPPSTTLLDFNRVSHPLIEIITLPHIHHPQTAAACVKKVQALLLAVNAIFTGMEMGGLRADVNVSVRQNEPGDAPFTTHSYHSVAGLGQRTEIKNLSSFKAIEDAIVAERDRQIDVLASGGIIDGETRGWALGSTETTRLRGKEGEVDYRYMPDPDLAPVIIGQDLIEHISNTLPELPDDAIRSLVNDLNLTVKDAQILVASESQRQLLYFDKTLWSLVKMLQPEFPAPSKASSKSKGLKAKHAKLVANWIVHELPGLVTVKDGYCDWNTMDELLPVAVVARVLENLLSKRITGQTAKRLLAMKVKGDQRDVRQIISEERLQLQTVSQEGYMTMAKALIEANPDLAQKAQQGQSGKLMWFVGQMMRQGKGSIEAERAKSVLEESLKRDTEHS